MIAKKVQGSYKSGNPKFSIIEAESYWKRKDPGPDKYKMNYEAIRAKRKGHVSMGKSAGRS